MHLSNRLSVCLTRVIWWLLNLTHDSSPVPGTFFATHSIMTQLASTITAFTWTWQYPGQLDIYTDISNSIFRGAWSRAPSLGTSETDTLLKMGFQTYVFYSKVPSKCRKCRFRDPNFKTFSGGACPRTPLQLCRHYGLRLTKILATPLILLYTFVGQ